MMNENLETFVERVREQIVQAPVDDYVKQEALKYLGTLVEYHTTALLEMATAQAEKEKVTYNKVDAERIDWEEREIRRYAAGLATQNGSFSRATADSILDFLKNA